MEVKGCGGYSGLKGIAESTQRMRQMTSPLSNYLIEIDSSFVNITIFQQFFLAVDHLLVEEEKIHLLNPSSVGRHSPDVTLSRNSN